MTLNFKKFFHTILSVNILALTVVACGDANNMSAQNGSSNKSAVELAKGISGGGGTCVGSCTGGGGTPVTGTNPLPTSAPAADILVHESFGPGPAGVRPKGGKGDLRSTFIGTTLGGFWVEWPGNKNNAWITPSGEATWKFAQSGGASNSHAVASPLEPYASEISNGVVWADITDGATGGYPTALLPVTWPTSAWAMSIETFPSYTAGSYVALGVTSSGATLANLASVGTISLELRNVPDGSIMVWQLWQGGLLRTLLASGTTEDAGYNQIKLSYNPQTQQLTPTINGIAGGSFSVNLGTPRYAAIEGNGVVDNFVLRKISN